MDIAKAVNSLLEKNNMTQADLARATGCSSAWINVVCNGKTNNIKLDKALLLSRALGVTIDEFAKLAGL